jgi:hypothetical protein
VEIIYTSVENDILGGTPYTKEEVKRYFGSWIELKTETDAGN